MRRRHFAIVTGLLALAGLLATDVRLARAQTVGDLFDAGTLQEFRLFMNSRDLALLRLHFDENTKYPADLQWRNIRVRNIAVRSRGGGSRNPTKIGLQISFDHYTTGQRFVGLTSLVLKNEYQDPSMIRERIAMAFYARMGQPASRESFGRVYVNGEYWGLYGIAEDVTADYLTRTLAENSGYLFEFHSTDYWHGEYLGDELASYKPRFEPKTHDLESDTILYSPIRDLFREVNGPDDAVWRSRVEQLVDLRQFITFVAIEVYLSEWDGMTGNWAMNNFYLYRSGGSTPHQFFPWDRDHSMLQITGDMPIFFRTDDNVLFHRAMAYSDLRTLYLDMLEQCAQSALQDDWFQTEIARSASLISPAAHDDTKKQFSNAEFDAEIEALKGFAQLRPAYVLQQVPKARTILEY